jgi:pimeloyl-ACP methyl ester carboxylesterase
MNEGQHVTLELHSGEVVVDGKRLETLWIQPERTAECAADGDAPAERATIVMLHEGLGSVAMWKDFPQKLAAASGHRVLAYSRYGHGSSQRLGERRPVEYMHYEGEVVLPELLDKLGVREPILLGHSDGGSISLIFAGKHPGQVRALMLEAPHVFVEDLTVDSIAKSKTVYQSSDLPRKLGRYHEHVDATFWGWNNIWLDPEFRFWNIEEYLPAIRCPILCIQGEDDEYGTRAQLEAIQAEVPATEILMLPDCAHSPHRDQPEATLRRMVEFLAEWGFRDSDRTGATKRVAGPTVI